MSVNSKSNEPEIVGVIEAYTSAGTHYKAPKITVATYAIDGKSLSYYVGLDEKDQMMWQVLVASANVVYR